MPGGAEGNALRRHGGIGAIDIVGGDKAGDVCQHPGLGGFSGIRTYFHDSLIK